MKRLYALRLNGRKVQEDAKVAQMSIQINTDRLKVNE
jgi:hypothetical protein